MTPNKKSPPVVMCNANCGVIFHLCTLLIWLFHHKLAVALVKFSLRWNENARKCLDKICLQRSQRGTNHKNERVRYSFEYPVLTLERVFEERKILKG